jgi:hypothetical protein
MGTPSFAVNKRYNSIRGYWKGSLTGGDRATVMVNFFHADTLVGSGMFTQDSKSTVPANYTLFAENIVWDARFTLTPTKATVGVFLTDSTFQLASNAGSQIYLEDLWLDDNFANTKPLTRSEGLSASCYPNPTKDQVTVSSAAGFDRIHIISSTGQLVYSEQFEHPATTTTVSLKQPVHQFGVYFIRLEGKQGVSTIPVCLQP